MDNAILKIELSQRLIAFLSKAHNSLLAATPTIKYKTNEPQQIIAVVLFGSIIQLSGDMVTLLQRERTISIPILLRTIFEAFVDIKNVCIHKTYWKSLLLENNENWIIMLQKSNDKDNDYLSRIAELPDRDERIARLRDDIRAIKKEGTKVKSIKEKCNKAAMNKEYQALYKALCMHSHNNLSALMHRHVEDMQDITRLSFYKSVNYEHVDPYILHTIDYLLVSATYLNDLIGHPISRIIETLADELHRLQDEIALKA